MNDNAPKARAEEPTQEQQHEGRHEGRPEAEGRKEDSQQTDPLHLLCNCIALIQFTIDDATRKLALNAGIQLRLPGSPHEAIYLATTTKIDQALRTIIEQLRKAQAEVFNAALEDHIGKHNAHRLIRCMSDIIQPTQPAQPALRLTNPTN
jgi:hypothetical protein